MKTLISRFLQNKELELYNEFSFQFELACFLKKENYIVEFEKNIKDCFNLDNIIKKEIDLVINDNKDKDNPIAIELKFPINGQVPVSMFNFIKDIRFLEQLVKTGKFEKGYFIIVTNEKNFWEGKTTNLGNNIYEIFRKEEGKIKKGKYNVKKGKIDGKSTEEKDILLENDYDFKWKKAKIKIKEKEKGKEKEIRYFCVEVCRKNKTKKEDVKNVIEILVEKLKLN